MHIEYIYICSVLFKYKEALLFTTFSTAGGCGVSSGEDVVDEGGELGSVLLAVASGGRSTDVSACVVHVRVLVVEGFELVDEARLNEGPRALVLWLFLGPDDLSVLVLAKIPLNVAEWEWSDLLHTHDGDIVGASLRALRVQIVEDLTRAENDLADLVVSNERLVLVIDDLLEAETSVEVLNVGHGATELHELL